MRLGGLILILCLFSKGYVYGNNESDSTKNLTKVHKKRQDKIPYYDRKGFVFSSDLFLPEPASFEFNTGYHFKHYASLTLGTGVQLHYFYFPLSNLFVPLYLRWSSEILKKRFTLLASLDMGYVFSISGTLSNDQSHTSSETEIVNTGGYYGSVSLGNKFYTKSKWSFVVCFQYQFKLLDITKTEHQAFPNSFSSTTRELRPIHTFGVSFRWGIR